MHYDNPKTAFTGLGPGHMAPRRRAGAETHAHRDGESSLARAVRRIVELLRYQRVHDLLAEVPDNRLNDLKLSRPGIASLKRPNRS
jgi:hypothetical protein